MAPVYSRNAPGDRKLSEPSAVIFLLLTRSEREFIRPNEIFSNELEEGVLGAGRAIVGTLSLVP